VWLGWASAGVAAAPTTAAATVTSTATFTNVRAVFFMANAFQSPQPGLPPPQPTTAAWLDEVSAGATAPAPVNAAANAASSAALGSQRGMSMI
jgi:hypothetical protein